MKLMLLVIFLCVGLGLLAPRFGRGLHLILALLATVMTALYYFFSARFM